MRQILMMWTAALFASGCLVEPNPSPVTLGEYTGVPTENPNEHGATADVSTPPADPQPGLTDNGAFAEPEDAGDAKETDVSEDAGTADVADEVVEPEGCPPDLQACVATLPFTDMSDTMVDGNSALNAYSCSPETDESGPEVVYRVTVTEPGFLSAAVYDDIGVDVDVHILSALSASACLDRGHRQASVDVQPGDYYVVVDSFVSDGSVFGGPYRVDIGFLAPSQGSCELETGVMKRVGDGGDHLAMPATGMMVLEAHLVTQDEPAPFPMTATEELEAHYELSQKATGLVMYRDQVWAPLEGGDHYGAGIGPPKLLPTIDEGWYVNMYWTKESRPARGTKMILRLPGSDRAVVVSAGHETGPGNLTRIGGTTEETHFYLGTGHLSEMTLGIATDQTLPFGPRTCE